MCIRDRLGSLMVLSASSYTMSVKGEDALGEAICKISCNGHTVTGRGLSPDILESSIRAYVNAINKAIAMEEKAMI